MFTSLDEILTSACALVKPRCVVKKLPIAEYSVVKNPLSYCDAATRGRDIKRVGPPSSLRDFGETAFAHRAACLAEAAITAAKAGGEYRDRTGDLLVANQALSQLS